MVERRPGGALLLEARSLWDFPQRDFGWVPHGDPYFHGAMPALAPWNLVRRYTVPGEVVLDPFAGSGTVLDVAREEGRRAVGCDVEPRRPSIIRADARQLPFASESVRLVIADPPYGDNLHYSASPRCIGNLAPGGPAWGRAMEEVLREARRVLRPGGHAAFIIADAYRHRRFVPLGFQLFNLATQVLRPVDIVCLARRNARTDNPVWEHRARTLNFFLRGFEYILIFRRD
jgi:SAM-dependent methyltransferase